MDNDVIDPRASSAKQLLIKISATRCGVQHLMIELIKARQE